MTETTEARRVIVELGKDDEQNLAKSMAAMASRLDATPITISSTIREALRRMAGAKR